MTTAPGVETYAPHRAYVATLVTSPGSALIVCVLAFGCLFLPSPVGWMLAAVLFVAGLAGLWAWGLRDRLSIDRLGGTLTVVNFRRTRVVRSTDLESVGLGEYVVTGRAGSGRLPCVRLELKGHDEPLLVEASIHKKGVEPAIVEALSSFCDAKGVPHELAATH